MIRTLVSAAFAALVLTTGFAHADDLNPPSWRGDPGSVMAEWAFATNNNPVSPVEFTPVSPGYPLYGLLPLATVTGAQWETYGGAGAWFFTVAGNISIVLPNFIDPLEMKWLSIQITYDDHTAPGSGVAFVSNITATDPMGIDSISLLDVETIALGPGPVAGTPRFHRTELWEIIPNPDFELITITVPQGTYVDQIVIDTISVPEVGSMGMLLSASMILGSTMLVRRCQGRRDSRSRSLLS